MNDDFNNNIQNFTEENSSVKPVENQGLSLDEFMKEEPVKNGPGNPGEYYVKAPLDELSNTNTQGYNMNNGYYGNNYGSGYNAGYNTGYNNSNNYGYNNTGYYGGGNNLNNSTKPEKGKKKKSGFLLKFAAVVCVLALCFGAGLFVSNYLPNKTDDVNNGTSQSASSSKNTNRNNVTNGPAVTNNAANTDSTSTSAPFTGSDANLTVANSDDSAKADYSFVGLAASVEDSVVAITTETMTTGSFFNQAVQEGAGSGVIVTADGYIVTNNHVISGANDITVTLNNDGTAYKATLAATDSIADIAVIKINKTGLKSVTFGDSNKLQVGDQVAAVGNPLGTLSGTFTTGVISALSREITIENQTMKLLQTTAAINPGNSGGGLFNMKGELIGVVNAKSSGTGIEGIGFAIPSNDAKQAAEDLMKYGYIKGRISLDMELTLVDITDNYTARMNGLQRLGTYISKVAGAGSAKDAGLQVADCIYSIDGAAISSSADFTKIVDGHKIGDKLAIVVYRNNQQVTCNVTLQEYKPS